MGSERNLWILCTVASFCRLCNIYTVTGYLTICLHIILLNFHIPGCYTDAYECLKNIHTPPPPFLYISINGKGAIHQRRPVERGVGVGQCGRLRTGGRPSTINQTYSKQILFVHCFNVSGVHIGVRHHLPPCPRGSGSLHILCFGRFYARYASNVRVGGGGCQTDDVGQGGSKKSAFARTSLMDDP